MATSRVGSAKCCSACGRRSSDVASSSSCAPLMGAPCRACPRTSEHPQAKRASRSSLRFSPAKAGHVEATPRAPWLNETRRVVFARGHGDGGVLLLLLHFS